MMAMVNILERGHHLFRALGPKSLSTTFAGPRCWKFRVPFLIVLFSLEAAVGK